jgi:hypothetical protein
MLRHRYVPERRQDLLASGRSFGSRITTVQGFARTLPLIAAAALLAGCGGERQDAHEPNGLFPVNVVSASFPAQQRLAQHTQMSITVRNAGSQTLPNLAVTVDGLDFRDTQPGLAAAGRPVWIVDAGPRGGITAYTNTWALGPVPPGGVRTFTWHLTAARAGQYVLRYTIAAGLNGKARAVQAGSSTQAGTIQVSSGTGGQSLSSPQGTFLVHVSSQPTSTYVDPNTGRVVTGTLPQGPPS